MADELIDDEYYGRVIANLAVVHNAVVMISQAVTVSAEETGDGGLTPVHVANLQKALLQLSSHIDLLGNAASFKMGPKAQEKFLETAEAIKTNIEFSRIVAEELDTDD